MTGNYDEMTERSYPDYTGGTEQQRKMRDLLRSKMEAEGFKLFMMNGGILIIKTGKIITLPMCRFGK